jgi:hypothetical protein
MRKRGNAHSVLVVKPEEKGHLEVRSVEGRLILKLSYINRM